MTNQNDGCCSWRIGSYIRTPRHRISGINDICGQWSMNTTNVGATIDTVSKTMLKLVCIACIHLHIPQWNPNTQTKRISKNVSVSENGWIHRLILNVILLTRLRAMNRLISPISLTLSTYIYTILLLPYNSILHVFVCGDACYEARIARQIWETNLHSTHIKFTIGGTATTTKTPATTIKHWMDNGSIWQWPRGNTWNRWMKGRKERYK